MYINEVDISDLLQQCYEIQELTPGLVKSLTISKNLSDKVRLYEAVMKDTHFLAKKLDRDSIIDKAQWSTTPTDNQEVDLYVTEKLWKILTNNKLKNIHEAIYKGLSVQEIIYNIDGEVQDIIDVPIQILKYKKDVPTGEDLIYSLNKNNKATLIDNSKIVVGINNDSIRTFPIGIAERLSNVIAGKYITLYKQLMKFNESVATPSLWGKYSNEQQKVDMINALKSIGSCARGVIPDNCSIEWLEAKNSDTDTFFNTLEYFDNTISRLIIGVVNSGESSVGSYSSLEAQINIKEDLISNSLDIICDAINKYLIPAIVDSKFDLVNQYPEFKLQLPKSKDIDRDIKLKQLEVKFTKKYIMDNYGLSEEDFDLL